MWASPMTFRIYFVGVGKNEIRKDLKRERDALKTARRGNSPVKV